MCSLCLLPLTLCSGESYAGIYVPTLVNTIRVMNEKSSNKINLKGFMVRQTTLAGIK